MNTKQVLQLCILVAGWLLTACTASGGAAVATTVATTPAPAGVIEHDGIRFTYDPALLGDVNIQDVPATADQGMFGEPTPAHTWFGFVPAGIVRDGAVHWTLTHEPQLIVFNLADFGSFAPVDEQARQQIAAFALMLADRPAAFAGEIPVLPPINAAQMFQAQTAWLDFDGGGGLRFLTAFTQEVIPAANDRLVYIFYGQTSDRQHGVVAIFPLAAAALPATAPVLSEADIMAFNENYAAEMAAVTERLNNSADADFTPGLAQLDALVGSIRIAPAANDYPVLDVAPQNALLLGDSDVYDAPDGVNAFDRLPAGAAVVVNGRSQDGAYSRILCADGTTGNCWLPAAAVQLSDVGDAVVGSSSGPVDDQVVQIQALVENVVFAAPDETAAQLGTLRVGETAMVVAGDESGAWYNITCPRFIGVSCWVIALPEVNQPIGFFSSDGWKTITSEHVTFRVPIEWNPTIVTPGYGSVLADWNLGIPGVDSDQTVAFFDIGFAELLPPDLVSETPFTIGGQPGAKWLRAGEGYVSYDYYTTGVAGAGSFGIHVTVAAADAELEALLDRVAESVVFSE